MKLTKYSSIASALAVLTTAPLLAQQHTTEVMRAPTFAKAAIGDKAVVSNERAQPLGVVRDHVIDRRSGKVLYVAVGAAENKDAQARLVPFHEFTWSSEQQRLTLPITREQLANMPAYDPRNLPPIDAGDKSGSAEALAGQALEAAAKRPPTLATTMIQKSDIVAASGERFCAARTLILDVEYGTVAFVLGDNKAAKDDPHVIPWPALTWQAPADGQRGRLGLTLTMDVLETAPTLRQGDTSQLDRKAVEKIFQFYKVTPPLAPEKKLDSRG